MVLYIIIYYSRLSEVFEGVFLGGVGKRGDASCTIGTCFSNPVLSILC